MLVIAVMGMSIFAIRVPVTGMRRARAAILSQFLTRIGAPPGTPSDSFKQAAAGLLRRLMVLPVITAARGSSPRAIAVARFGIILALTYSRKFINLRNAPGRPPDVRRRLRPEATGSRRHA